MGIKPLTLACKSDGLARLILASAQTCLICPDRVTGERRRLRHNVGLNYVKTMTAYVTMTCPELFEAPESWNFFKDFFDSASLSVGHYRMLFIDMK